MWITVSRKFRGMEPTGPEGYSSDVWDWRSLSDYCCSIAQAITKTGHGWLIGDDAGSLDATNANKLAAILQAEIESGRCAAYVRSFQARKDAHNEAVRIAELIDAHDFSSLSVADISAFAIFLRSSGGFTVGNIGE